MPVLPKQLQTNKQKFETGTKTKQMNFIQIGVLSDKCLDCPHGLMEWIRSDSSSVFSHHREQHSTTSRTKRKKKESPGITQAWLLHPNPRATLVPQFYYTMSGHHRNNKRSRNGGEGEGSGRTFALIAAAGVVLALELLSSLLAAAADSASWERAGWWRRWLSLLIYRGGYWWRQKP